MNQDIAKLHDVLNRTLDLLDEACELVRPAGVEPSKETVKLLGLAIANILHARKCVYDVEPGLRSNDEP